MFTVELKEDAIAEALVALAARLEDMSPVWADIGEILVNSTIRRFASGTSPQGARWPAKSPVTLAAYGARKSNRIDPRPLFGPSGMLNSQISAASGPDFVEVGSPMVYAAMMQFGGQKSAFPHLWGDIPARPFLGISEEDEAEVLAQIADYLAMGRN